MWSLGQIYGLVDALPNVVFSGDSITQGINSLADTATLGTDDYVSRTATFLAGMGKPINATNAGVGGTTASSYFAGWTGYTFALPNVRPFAPKKIWVHEIGVNDLLNSAGSGFRVDPTHGSVLQIWQYNVTQQINAIRALGMGYQIILATPTPAVILSSGEAAGIEPVRAAMRAWIFANYRNLGCVGVLDHGGNPDCANPNFHAEGNAGAQVLGSFPHFNGYGGTGANIGPGSDGQAMRAIKAAAFLYQFL
jgi:lysophospholipase L1-like esterase